MSKAIMLDPGGFELPLIPSKRYFTIGEVSKLCDMKPHVLRYWENEFPQLRPVKRRGNRRYYQRHEVKLIRYIRHLLYTEGFTISGARMRLDQMDTENGDSDTLVNAGLETSKLCSWLINELDELVNILR